MRCRDRGLRALIAVLAATGSASCSPSNASRTLVIRIVATDSGYVMPARVAAGITEIHLVNRGRTTHGGVLTVACWYRSRVRDGGIRDFDVVPARSQARPPRTDLTVRMFDYSYQFGGTWSAGSHRVLVENVGTEAHEFDPYRLEPGKRPADFFRWIESGRPGAWPDTGGRIVGQLIRWRGHERAPVQ